ncbi:MAG: GTPase HflX [Actinobacteria bacterium]|nr:GTPase HflX [Actinomycetota bacterium]
MREAGSRQEEAEIALLVAIQLPGDSDDDTADSLAELGALASTAGAEVSVSITQKRNRYEPATALGKGKLSEIERAIRSTGAQLAIFNNDLTVTQQERLQSLLDTKVIDRTALILDIFAQHAHTSEGRTQVELAQLNYLLHRIRGKGIELSRLGGGIGTRGPGETKLEVDRRRIRRRMRRLEKDLTQMESVRDTQRKQRRRAGLPSICLIGYTNSGKSSLLNRLTGANVLVEDQLFSTLDSTTRRLLLPDGQKVVVSDTVGFIRKLPHELIAAFHSTLEVVREADLLIHVVDATADQTIAEHMKAVNEALSDLEAAEIPVITAFNKVDLLESGQADYIKRGYPDALYVSALTVEGINALMEEMGKRLSGLKSVTLLVPVAKGDVLSALYRDGFVMNSEVQDECISVTVNLPPEKLERYRRYIS